MAWTAPTTRATGFLVTAAIYNADIINNLIELRGGGLAISGQAANYVPVASSATQLAASSALQFDAANGRFDIAKNQNAETWLGLSNSTSGAAADSLFYGVAGSTVSYLRTMSQGFTTSGYTIAASTLVLGTGVNGVVYAAADAAGLHRWYNGTTENMRLFPSGCLSIGNAVDSGVSGIRSQGQIHSVNGGIISGGVMSVASGSALFLDGLGDTYLFESAANVISMVTNGVEAFNVRQTFIYVPATNKIYLDGGGDTYIWESSGNVLDIVSGNNTAARFAGNTTATLFGDARFGTTSNFSWVAKSASTVYQAASDGFVVVRGHVLNAGDYFEMASDGSNPPTTVRATVLIQNTRAIAETFSFMCPVIKGDYYKVYFSGGAGGAGVDSLWWVPLGYNG